VAALARGGSECEWLGCGLVCVQWRQGESFQRGGRFKGGWVAVQGGNGRRHVGNCLGQVSNRSLQAVSGLKKPVDRVAPAWCMCHGFAGSI